MATTEHTINDVIATLLRGTRWAWRGDEVVRSETTGLLADSGGLRPDILVLEPYTAPVAIETEIMPARTVEAEALGRLGQPLSQSEQRVLSAIGLRLPARLREKQADALQQAIATARDLEFAHFAGRSPHRFTRYPRAGWLKGGLHELSMLAQSATMPAFLVEEAANVLEIGVNAAAHILKEIEIGQPMVIHKIAMQLNQQDSVQTRRMAMTILINAFLFYETLANGSGILEHIRSYDELRSYPLNARKHQILLEWDKILEVNYWPIFDISQRILTPIPPGFSGMLVERLALTSQGLAANNLMRSHDLTGTVFQKLIADRKFLAAFYTKPASAALLVGLAVSEDSLLAAEDWARPDSIKTLRIADFACGTGTLLSAAYQRVSQLHELHGGNAAAIHADMIENALLGCDILPAAAHLTASTLSGAHPTVQYQGGRIFTLRYGRQEDGTVALGAIDLLRDLALLQGSEITAKASEGLGEAEKEAWRYAPHVSFDLVIMNPPFTRPTNHEGRHENVPNPMFAAFGSSAEEQKAMAGETKKLTKGTVAHGNAGQASIFLALADRKLARDGMLAMVMPLTLLTGVSWQKCRNRLAESYDSLILISIAGSDSKSMSFSADTGMAECLVIGKRNGKRQSRAVFVVLERSPQHPAFSAKIAEEIRRLIEDKAIRQLEDNPAGGTHIRLGEELVGQAIDAPLPSSGSWKVARIVDFSLAQCAYQLAENGQVWLPAQFSAIGIPVSTVGSIGETGPIGRDINGTNPDGSIRGPFDVRETRQGSVPTFPILWAHNLKREKTMLFDADREGLPRKVESESEQEIVNSKAEQVFETATHCHHNVDFQFNAQSTAMQFTARKTIGGRAWLSIMLENDAHEKALTLWGNSLLGLLMYWWHASRQQAGRGSLAKSAVQDLTVLDVTALTAAQLQRAAQIFDAACQLPLKPLHQLDSDENRKLLDRRFYGEVLGLPDELLKDGGPLDALRYKLSREPSVRGGKP